MSDDDGVDGWEVKQLNFDDARTFCQGLGGDLAILKEKEELALLRPSYAFTITEKSMTASHNVHVLPIGF